MNNVFNTSTLEVVNYSLVLSTNSSVLGLSLNFILIVTLGRSLTQIKKSNSSNINPCGTPFLTYPI
jgi:hypothetical protein